MIYKYIFAAEKKPKLDAPKENVQSKKFVPKNNLKETGAEMGLDTKNIPLASGTVLLLCCCLKKEYQNCILGIYNIGNTCYASAAIAMLKHLDWFNAATRYSNVALNIEEVLKKSEQVKNDKASMVTISYCTPLYM